MFLGSAVKSLGLERTIAREVSLSVASVTTRRRLQNDTETPPKMCLLEKLVEPTPHLSSNSTLKNSGKDSEARVMSLTPSRLPAPKIETKKTWDDVFSG